MTPKHVLTATAFTTLCLVLAVGCEREAAVARHGATQAGAGQEFERQRALMASATYARDDDDTLVVTLTSEHGAEQIERWSRLGAHLLVALRNELTTTSIVYYLFSMAKSLAVERPGARVDVVDWLRPAMTGITDEEVGQVLVDAWGQAMYVEPVGDEQLRLCSPGEDGARDTDDDICVLERY